MGDHEISAGFEVALPLPDTLGVAKAHAAYKGSWTNRGRQYANDVAEKVGLAPAELEETLVRSAVRRDIFYAGGQRVVEVEDPTYRQAVADAVANALDTDVELDEAAYICNEVLGLDPVQLRIFILVWRHREHLETNEILMSITTGLSRPLISAACQRLASRSLIGTLNERVHLNAAPEALRATFSREAVDDQGFVLWTGWTTSEWGTAVAQVCDPGMGASSTWTTECPK